jgi:hypothetical protein
LILQRESLGQKFSELLTWEKTKRREQILISLSFFALAAALLAWPFSAPLSAVMSLLWLPLLFFLGIAPFMFWNKRWRPRDSTRAVAELDKKQRLEARAITAWEILGRGENNAAEELVVKQAEERLNKIDVKAVLEKPHNWQAYLVLPLFMIWLTLVWLDGGVPGNGSPRLSLPQALAYRLREFSRELQEKAQNEGLRETMQWGRELEKIAQRGIDSNTSDERLKSDLAGMNKKLDAMQKASPQSAAFSGAESQQSLRDLKSELEAARDLAEFGDAKQGPGSQNWLDRLEGLPQLKRQFDKPGQAGQGLSQDQLKSFLDRLEKQVTSELDRRTLLDAQQFLERLMNQGQKRQSDAQMAGRNGEQALPDDGERARSRSSLPGHEAGKKEESQRPAPEFAGGAATHLKGLLGEGQSDGVTLKGRPSAGKSEISQEEVVATYRRQAEAELNTERIPDSLKETIKNYFLSLGIGERQK